MRHAVIWSLLAAALLLLGGCSFGRSSPEAPTLDPVEVATAKAKADTNAQWLAKVNAMLADHAATVTDLTKARDEAVALQKQHEKEDKERIDQLNAGIKAARERNIARAIYAAAILSGVIAISSLVLFFVFPAFGSLERGLATGCAVAACVLWWLGAHVHELPWIGASVVAIGAAAALLKAGTIAAIVARLKSVRSAIQGAVAFVEDHHSDAGATLRGALQPVQRLVTRVESKL